MNSPVIVIARDFPEPMLTPLRQFAEVRVYDSASPDESLRDARVWLGTAVDPVTAQLIQSFPDSLGLVANLGVGLDNVDLEAAAQAGILVTNTPVVTEDTADLTFALLMATCRRLGECERALRADDWMTGVSLLGQRVHGATLGIVGFGAIGQAVARRANGFAMNVIYHGPSPKPEAEQQCGARYCATLDELLESSDIVSLNCPLSDDTRHLINEKTLAKFKPGAVLINTGRGPLVHEEALVQALESGHLGGAGLDVFEFEPSVTPTLLNLPKVTLLPHIGSATAECRKEMVGRAFANIASYLKTGNVLDGCTS